MPGRGGDVLLAVNLIGYWAGRDLTAETHFPQKHPGACIESVEVTFAAAGEEDVGCCREDAAVGDVRHQELPLPVSRFRINGDDHSVSGRLRPRVDGTAAKRGDVLSSRNRAGGSASDKAPALFVVLRFLYEHAGI